jgi:hypothetical protein
MILGATLVYKCPECGKFFTRGSLHSGNTFHSKIYSDGKRIAPMLPEFPLIIKCTNCKTFFWLIDENYVGKWDSEREMKVEWKNAGYANFLSADEYNEAINLKIYNVKKDQIFLRIRLWWTINDKIRNENDVCIADEDKIIYEQNCMKLLELLDNDEIDWKLIRAELFRNLGKFSECKNVLETITDEEYIWIREIMEEECRKNNRNVITLMKPMRPNDSPIDRDGIGQMTDDELEAHIAKQIKS